MERQPQGMDRPGVLQVPEGSGEQGKMEETDCEIFCGTLLRVHDLQAYRQMDVTREHISGISELREILLSFQTGFNLFNAAV